MSTALEQLKNIPEAQRHPYIKYMRFPFYKNLTSGARIDFSYPITAIVGMNGSSKSSILRAIYGAPTGKSISDYWFESNIDTIKDGATENTDDPEPSSVRGATSAFIYGYYNNDASRDVEALKTRIRNKNRGLDYWEPAKPQAKYGMAKMPPVSEVPIGKGRSQTRWNTIEKNVVYLDFRHEAVSAFDKCFYNGTIRETDHIKSRQDFIRYRTKYLKEAIADNLSSYIWHRKERIVENTIIPETQKAAICKILDKQYSQIRVIKHCFFTETLEKTIYLSCDDLEYSEAFAGSGEFAVVSLVTAVMNAPDKSLILLDEPEVSVHPGAQEKLLEFLANQALQKKHQIIFTTHSQSMIRSLPKEAIRVLYEDTGGKINIRSNIYPSEAFSAIGASFERKTLIVEDKVARKLVEHILKDYNILDQFDVKESPNGAEWIKTRDIVDSAIFDRNNVIYLLDGDKRRSHVDPQTIPPAEYTTLGDKIIEQTGCPNIVIPHIIDNNNDKVEKQLKFLQFYKDKVFYFPTNDPEDIIWAAVPDTDKNGINNPDSKRCFALLVQQQYDYDTAHYILATQERYIHSIDSRNNLHCQAIYTIAEKLLQPVV